MKIKLKDQEVKSLRLAMIHSTQDLHPSRHDDFIHEFYNEGRLKPSKHLWTILNLIEDLIKQIHLFPELKLHLLQYQRTESNYMLLLPILSSVSHDHLQFRQFGIDFGYKMKEFKQKGLDKIRKRLKQNDRGLSIPPTVFTRDEFLSFGFELSLIELETLLEHILECSKPIKFPLLQSKSANALHLGADPRSQEIIVEKPDLVLGPQDPKIISAFTSQGILITQHPEKYVEIADYYHELSFSQSPIGINLIQFYTIEPALLIDLMSVLKTLTNDYNLERSFLTVLDELFSTMPREEFYGISFSNFFIHDEYNAYQTMSDQQSKYQLHQQFARYLDHPVFNENKIERLDKPGLHLIDVSNLTRDMGIMVDVMFRLLQHYQYIEGYHISDLFGSSIISDKFDNLSKVHNTTLSHPSIVLYSNFSTELFKSSDWDYLLIDMVAIRQLDLSDFQKSVMGIENFEDYIDHYDGYLLSTRFHDTTILSDIDQETRKVELPVLTPIAFDYSINENDEVVADELLEDELEQEIFDETYLSHYHIISILAAMPDYKNYRISDVELALWSEYPLTEFVDQMVDRQYLKQVGKGYEVDSKGRSYLINILKQVRKHTANLNEDYENALQHLTTQITEYLTEKNIGEKLEVLYRSHQPLTELVEKLKKKALLYHYHGLVAATQYKLEQDEEEELINEYMKQFNAILDDLTAEEDLIEKVMNEMDEDGNVSLDEAVEKVVESEETQEIIKEVAEQEIIEEQPGFEPAVHEDIGRWYPTKEFQEIVDIEFEDDKKEPSATDLFVLYQLNYYKISTLLEIELYLERMDLEDRRDHLLNLDYLTLEDNQIEVDLSNLNYPMVPPSTKSIAKKEIIPRLIELQDDLAENLKSQSNKQLLVEIFSMFDLNSFGFILHAMMYDTNEYLVELLDHLISSIIDPEEDIPENLKQTMLKSKLYRDIHNLETTVEVLEDIVSNVDESAKDEVDDKSVDFADPDAGDIRKQQYQIENPDEVDQKTVKKKVRKASQAVSLSSLPKPKVKGKEQVPRIDYLESVRKEKEITSTEEKSKIDTESKGKEDKEKDELSSVNKPDSSNDSNTSGETEDEVISVLGYPLKVTTENSTEKDPETREQKPTSFTENTPSAIVPPEFLSDKHNRMYEEIINNHKPIKLEEVDPQTDLSYEQILEILYAGIEKIEESPDAVLKGIILQLFSCFGIDLVDLSTDQMLINLSKVSKRIDITFEGFIQNFADIRANWEEKKNTTILYYYLNRCISTANSFEWNDDIRKFIS